MSLSAEKVSPGVTSLSNHAAARLHSRTKPAAPTTAQPTAAAALRMRDDFGGRGATGGVGAGAPPPSPPTTVSLRATSGASGASETPVPPPASRVTRLGMFMFELPP